jgi:hypothetical protein
VKSPAKEKLNLVALWLWIWIAGWDDRWYVDFVTIGGDCFIQALTASLSFGKNSGAFHQYRWRYR